MKSFLFGLLATFLYLAMLSFFIFERRDEIVRLELNAIGDFLAGVFGPLAVFWLILGFFLQGRELSNSSRALASQVAEMEKTVRQQEKALEQTETLLEISRDELSLTRDAIDRDRISRENEERNSYARSLHRRIFFLTQAKEVNLRAHLLHLKNSKQLGVDTDPGKIKHFEESAKIVEGMLEASEKERNQFYSSKLPVLSEHVSMSEGLAIKSEGLCSTTKWFLEDERDRADT